MQQRNIFSGPYLDRAAHLRQDPEWFAAALADERSRAIPVWNSRNLIAEGDIPRAVYWELSRLPPEPPPTTPGTRFEDLRLVAAVLPIDEAGLLGYARAIVSWRRRHRFCGTCGAKTLSPKSGHVLGGATPGCPQ